MTNNMVLSEVFATKAGANLRTKQVIMVLAGIAALAISAQIRVPMWPVPVTMQTFAVLTIGAAFGTRLGLMTLLGYILLGAAGVAVFAGEASGLAYIAGPTGGYLVGFVVAAGLMGAMARRGWDKSIAGMAGAMLAGTATIYTFGLAWMSYLFMADKGAAWVLQYGMGNFLAGDALKLVLAALIVPGVWKMIRR